MLWITVLVLSLAIILFAAELFTNGVEWVGFRLGLGEGVVGSVLAAVGTAMPETLIPIVAILFFGEQAANEVGIGAILGAPFMLSTLAMLVVGSAVLIFAWRGRRSTVVKVDEVVLSRDVSFFLAAYSVAVLAGFIGEAWVKSAIAVGLLALYVVYVLRHFADAAQVGEQPKALHASIWLPRGHGRLTGRGIEEVWHHYCIPYSLPHAGAERPPEAITPLYFLGKAVPKLRMCLGQTFLALALMLIGAHTFVQAVGHVSANLGIPALVLALIIAPVATELPEKFNSVLWVRVGKDTLAMGNITGAMVFQSCIPVAIGLAFTHWALSTSGPALASAIISIVAATTIFGISRWRGGVSATFLLIGGLFYAAYLAYLFIGGSFGS